MKTLRIIFVLMAVVAVSASFSTTHRDAGVKSIERLWEEYAKAERQDQIRRRYVDRTFRSLEILKTVTG